MGLGDLGKDEQLAVGKVSTRLKGEDIEMSTEWWLHYIMSHNPEILIHRLDNRSEQELRFFIEQLDKVIQDEVSGMVASEEQIEMAKRTRGEIKEALWEKM